MEKVKQLILKIRFQFLLLSIAGLVFFKTFFFNKENFFSSLVNELIILVVAYYIIINIKFILAKYSVTPLTLVYSLVGLNVVLIAFTLSANFILWLIGINKPSEINTANFPQFLISTLYILCFLGIIGYVALVFRELFFQKQKKNLKTYFNAFIVFLILASITSVFDRYENLKFIRLAFFANAIILIIYNSTKISWIAFLTKKQKRNLLFFSILLIVLFTFNVANVYSDSINATILAGYSLSLVQFKLIINIYGIIYFSFLFFTTLFHLPTAEAFDRKATEVSSLQFFSTLINQVLDFNELSDTITNLAVKISDTEASFIISNKNEVPKIVSVKNMNIETAEEIFRLIKEKKETLTNNSFHWTNVNNAVEKENSGDKYLHAFIVPLISHNKNAGYLVSLRKKDLPFDDEDCKAIQTFADYASVAIENSRLFEESIEKERLERELYVAREMQRKLIPQKNPEYDQLEIATVFIPAFEVGGDYYDFFNQDKNSLSFVIADVAGKGITAAFMMAEIRGIFESLIKTFSSPREILVNVNQLLKRSLEKNSFVSAIFGVFNFEKSHLTLARAGHTSLLLAREDKIIEYRPEGCGLGLTYSDLFEKSLFQAEIKLQQGDVLALYTDGITEAKNEKLEDFGLERLKNLLSLNREKPSNEIANGIIKEVTLFSQKTPQWDDITLILFKWKNNGVK